MNKKALYIFLIFLSIFFCNQSFASQTRLYGNIILPEIPRSMDEVSKQEEIDDTKEENDDFTIIEDELILLLNDKKISKPKKAEIPVYYDDEIIEQLRDIKFEPKKTYNPEEDIIEDDVIKEKFAGRKIYKQRHVELPPIEDHYLLPPKDRSLERVTYTPRIIDENSKEIKVRVSASNSYVVSILSKDEDLKKEGKAPKFYLKTTDIGDKIVLKIIDDVKKDGKVFIKEGTEVEGIIGNVTPPVSGGGGAELVLENLKTHSVDGDELKLNGKIIVKGMNTAFFQNIISYAGIPFTFGASVFIMYSPGGPATLKANRGYTLFYEEEMKDITEEEKKEITKTDDTLSESEKN